MNKIVIKQDYYVYIGQRQQICLKLTVPARTGNDWEREKMAQHFITLPLMDKETAIGFKDAVNEIIDTFLKEEGID